VVGRVGHLTMISGLCNGQPKPIGAWLWIHKGVASLDEGFVAAPDSIRRHLPIARLVCHVAALPPLTMSYAVAAAGARKRARSRTLSPRHRPRSPSCPGLQAAARPSGGAPPYRPPARWSLVQSRSPRAACDARPRHGQGHAGSLTRSGHHPCEPLTCSDAGQCSPGGRASSPVGQHA
jgi:hypothetical protein